MEPRQRTNRLCLLILFISATVYASVFSYFLIIKYYNLDACLYNGMGIRMLNNFLQGQGFRPYHLENVPAVKHFIVLYPSCLLELPFFILFPYPELPLIAQSALLACAVFPLYYLGYQILKSKLLSLSIAAAYLLHPYVNLAALQGYRHPVMAVPLLFGLFYFLCKKERRKTLIFLILANSVIINVVWMTALLGLIFYLTRKEPLDKLVLKISSVWLAATAIIFSGLLIFHKDSFPATYIHLNNYGTTLPEVIKTIFTRPDLLMLAVYRNIGFFINLFVLPPGIFSLFAWPFLLPAAPETAFNLILANKISTILLIIPFFFLAAIYGIAALKESAARFSGGKIGHTLWAILLFTWAVSAHYRFPPQDGETPIFSRHFDFNKYRITKHAYIGHYIFNLIPRDGSCLATEALTNHLYDCKKVGDFPEHWEKQDWDYILVDTRYAPKEPFEDSFGGYRNLLNKLLSKDSRYGVYLFLDGYLLFKKGLPQKKQGKMLENILRSL